MNLIKLYYLFVWIKLSFTGVFPAAAVVLICMFLCKHFYTVVKNKPSQVCLCVWRTLRKWRVAMKRGVSFSWFFAHCSASGDKASKHSWLISELILNVDVKENKLPNILQLSAFDSCTRNRNDHHHYHRPHHQGTLLSAAETFCKKKSLKNPTQGIKQKLTCLQCKTEWTQ